MTRRWFLLLALVAAGACGQATTRDTAAGGGSAPAGGGPASINIPVSTPGTLRTPLSVPQNVDGVKATIPPEKPCTIKATIENHELGFAYDSFEVSPAGRSRLVSFVGELLRNAQKLDQIDLDGFASSEGEAGHNQTLSQHRADAVAALLTTIPALQRVTMKPVGRGIANPVGDNGTTEGRESNRRVELHFHFTGCG